MMEIEMMPRNETASLQTDALPPHFSPVLAQIAGEDAGLAAADVRGPVLARKGRARRTGAGIARVRLAHPDVSELRVLFGMALCVDFKVPDAIEELREGVRLAPDSFIAHLKMGELWMRLRVCEKAEEHTRQAALLARNMAQSELARRQAATIRTMMHNGIKRGGYAIRIPGDLSWTWRKRRLWPQRPVGEGRRALAPADSPA